MKQDLFTVEICVSTMHQTDRSLLDTMHLTCKSKLTKQTNGVMHEKREKPKQGYTHDHVVAETSEMKCGQENNTENRDDAQSCTGLFPDIPEVICDILVVNQCDRDGREEIYTSSGKRVLWIDTTQRGLSRSRNLALSQARADICLLADDDMVYRADVVDIVQAAFSRYDCADVIGFSVHGIERTFKRYKTCAKRVGYLSSMKMASVELAMRRKMIRQKGLAFDIKIGAGTQFQMGEENAFLFDALHKHCHIYFVPQCIADLHIGQSTWFDGYDRTYFMGKGAAFCAMRTHLLWLLMLQFAYRHRRLFAACCTPWQAFLWMLQGAAAYRDCQRQQIPQSVPTQHKQKDD